MSPAVRRSKVAAKHTKHDTLCAHDILFTSVSPHATALSFYKPPTSDVVLAAAQRPGKGDLDATSASALLPSQSSFPHVNLLPQDELDLSPREPGDTLKVFLSNRGRRTVTPSTGCLYIFDVPDVAPDMAETMTQWADPLSPEGLPNDAFAQGDKKVDRLSIDDIAGYIDAFYAGMDVKIVRNHFSFQKWRKGQVSNMSNVERGHVALASPDGSSTRIRFRPSQDGVTKGQLNLNDILDALLSNLPSDAFAALLVTDHDLYEDEDDDFCAGRAYGGSGICVVSTFRYHPALDGHASVNHAHSWPASHCREYVDECWEKTEPGLKDTDYGQEKRTKKGRAKIEPSCMLDIKQSPKTALGAAVLAAREVMIPETKDDWTGFWLGRVCRTASHELGHCVGIDHCVYYACNMQGTASIAEDMGQPPYLCPICLRKVAYSLVGEAALKKRGPGKLERSLEAEQRWVLESYRKMKAYCEKRKEIAMFAGYAAWLDVRLEELDGDSGRFGAPDDEDAVMGDDSSLIFMGSTERRT